MPLSIRNVIDYMWLRKLLRKQTADGRSLALEGADVAVAKPDLCTIYVLLGHVRVLTGCVRQQKHGWG